MTTKSTSKAVAAAAPTLPGILPSRPVADLVENINARYDGPELVANRLPNASERQMLQKRHEELERLMTPMGRSVQGAEMLRGKILAPFFGAYPKMAYADNEVLVESYTLVLQTLPFFAVQRAMEAIIDGTARKRNGRGDEVPFSGSEPPSAIEIRQLALKEMESARAQMVGIDKSLRVKRLDRIVDQSPETKQKISEGFDGLVQQLAKGLRPDRLERMGLRRDASDDEENAAVQRENDRKRDEAARLSERAILGRYQQLGIDPRYSKDGFIISPEIACPDQVALAQSRMRDRS